ncbi:MAG: DUF1800 family protein, partial [Burkholderiaceae bacterium]
MSVFRISRGVGGVSLHLDLRFAIASALALSLSACGGGGGSSSDAKETTQKVGSPSPGPGTPIATPIRPITMAAADAMRLLDQATFGTTPGAVAEVQASGAKDWLDAQLAAPTTGYAAIDYIDPNSAIGCPTGSVATCYRDNYTAFPVQLQFFRNAVYAQDQLRQRVAFAYSQIFVISNIDIKETYGLRAYQQMLLDDAFANYRTLIEHVTLHPAMGDYLDMVNNNKPTA